MTSTNANVMYENDLSDMVAHYEKLNGTPLFAAFAPLIGSSAHYDASQMSGQYFFGENSGDMEVKQERGNTSLRLPLSRHHGN